MTDPSGFRRRCDGPSGFSPNTRFSATPVFRKRRLRGACPGLCRFWGDEECPCQKTANLCSVAGQRAIWVSSNGNRMEAKQIELEDRLAEILRQAADVACQIQKHQQGAGTPHYDQIESAAHDVGQQLSRMVPVPPAMERLFTESEAPARPGRSSSRPPASYPLPEASG